VYQESTKGGGESRFAKFVSRNGWLVTTAIVRRRRSERLSALER